MVHIPLLGIDVPEPRLEHIIPDIIETIIHALARILDASQDVIHPLDSEAQEDYEEAVVSTIAPEFYPVMQRLKEGKILNTEQLSSEADEASFDFYRRGIREGMVGYKDEGLYERSLRRLGDLDNQLTPTEAAWIQHHHDQNVALLRNPESCSASSSEDGASLPVLDVGHELEKADWRTELAIMMEDLEAANQLERYQVQRAVRKGSTQVILSSRNAGLGLGLGLLFARGVGFVAVRLAKQLQKRRRRAAKAAAAAAGIPVAPRRGASAAGAEASQQSGTTRAGAGSVRGSGRQGSGAAAAATGGAASSGQAQEAAAAGGRRARPGGRPR